MAMIKPQSIWFYIYKFEVNERPYIGKTCDIKYRMATHLRAARSGSVVCPKLYNAMRKYGVKSIEPEILSRYRNEDEAYRAEAQLIERFDSFRNGLNSTPGGVEDGMEKIILFMERRGLMNANRRYQYL
jgi:predicted GIY-YIG superfamily endonuclease